LARTTRTYVRSPKTAGSSSASGEVPIAGNVSEQADEVAEVAPHELRREHAVRRRAGLDRPLDVAVICGPAPERRPGSWLVGNAALAQLIENRVVLEAQEVFLRRPWTAAVAKRLEVLLGSPCDAGLLECLADERAAAARGGADEEGALGHGG
jgi:hypothetical protein